MKSFEHKLGDSRLERLIGDIRRAAAAGAVEFTPEGIMVFGAAKVQVGGVFGCQVKKHHLVLDAIEQQDPERETWARNFIRERGDVRKGWGYETVEDSYDANLVPTIGLDTVNDILLGATSKITTWYQGLFESNWTPAAGALSNWAGAGSGPLATELANNEYDESNRQAAAFAASSGGIIATSSATRFTLASGVSGISLYGSTLNSIATVAYNATDEVLLAATRFAAAKTGLSAADIVDVTYQLTSTST